MGIETASTQRHRDPATVSTLLGQLSRATTRPWRIMEVCGGQTHAILRMGLDQLLPGGITLLHGPGCPVCVTEPVFIDTACRLAADPRVILCSFGDMLRVPGNIDSLQSARARGGDIRIVYSPMDALALAAAHPEREVVFLAVGFETTAPANALAVLQARRAGVRNFSLLVAQVTVPPALLSLLGDPRCDIDGFLAAGHVCTVMGYHQYHAISAGFKVPIVVTGFEPVDIVRGILACVMLLERGESRVENCYSRSVRECGNVEAQRLIGEVFQAVDRSWRGFGCLPASGLGFAPDWRDFDASRRFGLSPDSPVAHSGPCRAGEIMQGRLRPDQCEAFGTSCTPEQPLGAPMVSSEGACNAWFQYRREGADA
jgi:hydrogenase expression/formation protein HypD